MSERGKQLLVHFGVVAVLALVSLVYFFPVLKGKAIYQSDIVQYRGMAKERDTYKEETGKESYWTNSAFGGMPTFQLGANYPHNYVKKLDRVIRFLPRPADYLFLYFLSFYVFLLAMRVRVPWATAGALLFGLSTYYLIILEVGHNAKAHAIGYMPLVLAGILLVFRKKWVWGGLLTALALALEVGANHYQMTYYLGLATGLLVLFKAIERVRLGKARELIPMIGVLLLSLFFALGLNATSLMATSEYTRWSTRGPSEISISPDGDAVEATNGLDFDYITQYSYGPWESLNLIVPGLFGGSNSEDIGNKSHTYKYLRERGVDRTQAADFAANLPLYWGEQPIVAAPAYLGVVVFFCFLFGAFLLRNNYKWWLISSAILGLVLSWGYHVEWFTRLLIDYLPLYNKFRAVSSVQVITELSVTALAVLGVYEYSRNPSSDRSRITLYRAGGITLGILLLLWLFKGAWEFSGGNDALYQQYYGKEFVDNLIKDRKELYSRDLWRSILLVVTTGLFFILHRRLGWKPYVLLTGWVALALFDLWGVGKRYVNADSFDNPTRMERPFRAMEVDQQIKADKEYYRVLNLQEGINGARTSYFHRSIGGYHAAKPQTIQNIFEFHIDKGNLVPMHMLNVRYMISQNEQGVPEAVLNTEAYGNAWFAERIAGVPDLNAALMSMDSLSSDSVAVIVKPAYPELEMREFSLSDEAGIELTSYAPDSLVYRSRNPEAGFAVFSEMWYPRGWKARIDGEEVPIYRVNYTLRGIEIPAGQHELVFRFDPPVIRTGSRITLLTSLAYLGILLYFLFRLFVDKERFKSA